MREGGPGQRLLDDFSAEGIRVALLVSRFNEEVTEELLEGARACLRAHGVEEPDRRIYRVPGAWELPQAAARIVEAGGHDALVALGCVIRGETPHFDFIGAEATRGLGAVARDAPIPLTFGVLTTDTHEQARERADRDGLNKGWEAALAALEMLALYRRIEEEA